MSCSRGWEKLAHKHHQGRCRGFRAVPARRIAKRLDQGFSRAYQWGLMHSMRNAVAEKRRRMKLPLKIRDLSKLKTFRF